MNFSGFIKGIIISIILLALLYQACKRHDESKQILLQAELLMKGFLGSDRILKAVLDKEIGLRTKQLLSHAYVLKIKKYEKLLTVTDAAMNIAPNLEQKAQILQNVINFCHCS